MTHALHYFPTDEQDQHAPIDTCVCKPEQNDDGTHYVHRRTYLFGWTYPCCGKSGEGHVYGGQDGPSSDTMGTYIDALPHDCE